MTVASDVYNLSETYAEEPRPAKCIVIGAGVSGICFTYKAKQIMENFDFVIYEKNPEVGGTWYESRYPGCSCDIPSHSYTYSWTANPNWSRLYVGSEEIFDYFQGLAEKYGVYEKTKFETMVIGAKWLSDRDQWEVEVKDLKTGTVTKDYAEFLMNCGGLLNNWKWPDIPGFHDFKGTKLHSAKWDKSVDVTNKRVAVIGSGSSAIQIVPSIQPSVSHLVSFNRSPNWVTEEFSSELAFNGRETTYDEETRKKWAENREEFLKWRRRVEDTVNRGAELSLKGSELNEEVTSKARELMEKRLDYDPVLCKALIPEFPVGCKRITPGYLYLESLVEKNVEVVSVGIKHVTENGIVDNNGKLHELDIIVAATGFDTTFTPRFPIIGLDGIDLRDKWTKGPAAAYMSVAVPQLPNYFMTAGPNSPISNGSLIGTFETQIGYAMKLMQKVQKQGIRYMVPKEDATREFNYHKDVAMQRYTYSSNCTSWYKSSKPGAPISGPWPGSSIHFRQIMQTPRYEDYDYAYQTDNRFQYLGIGRSRREYEGKDLGWYVAFDE
ncbi:hypothetical protein AWJ20_4624 [Sugiyamaella lignohabitans]|uniref:FAD/NAD(P)-binding domain-containing protein n=1 Tax=Sugiyamaella lignohabitans TaxID=796027 RepID=A0A167E5W4_9ASCO|nr:uncharacterized protein AWJ20_4624 [Sugiyamaella lignohabitans]ANB13681.1 hypothetical protein AWJ20_4624 [Sugiyamaella lignohabitans]